MDKKNISILIVDDDLEWCEELKAHLEAHTSFDLLPPVHDGIAALDMIELHKPNIILLDIILPGREGREIVKYIAKNMQGYHPIIYVLSMINSKKTKARLMGYEAVVEYSIKPVELDTVLSNIFIFLDSYESSVVNVTLKNRDVLPAAPSKSALQYSTYNLDEIIEKQLMELGVRTFGLCGSCIRGVIETYMKAGKNNRIPLKEVYEQVGQTFTPQLAQTAVERNVRYAIEKARNARTPLFKERFSDGAVTNSVFVKGVTNFLFGRLEREHV